MIVAISGKSGCGNTTVTRLVADTLHLRRINYTFKDIAAERGVDFEELHRRAATDPEIDHYLDRRQVELASSGNCVLGSRLAIWLLENADLRVYIDAPLQVRGERIALREGIPPEEAIAATAERDAEDRRRYIALYGVDIDDSTEANLVVDAANNDQVQVANIVVAAARKVTGD